MSEVYCKGCGHSFPQKGKDLVSCPHCGREKHIPGAIQCAKCGTVSKKGTKFCTDCGVALFKLCSREGSGCGNGPLDADYCSECGAPLVEYEAFMANLEAERAALSKRHGFASILVVILLLAGAWFLCIAPIGKWFSNLPPALTSVRVEATAQVELAQVTAAFEDIEITVGEIMDREKRAVPGNPYWEDLYDTYPVIVENRGDDAHTILIAYWLRENNGNLTGPRYEELEVPPNSTVQFVVKHLIGYANISGPPGYVQLLRHAWFLAKAESVDGISRETTAWADRDWDWAIEIVDDAPYKAYK